MSQLHNRVFVNAAIKMISLIILTTSIVNIPIVNKYFYDQDKLIFIAFLSFVQLLCALFTTSHRITFKTIDLGWLAFIAYSFLSALWAREHYNVFFCSFISLQLYILYKLFETFPLGKVALNLLCSFTVIINLGLMAHIHFYSEVALESKFAFGMYVRQNYHYMGSLTVILLPFIYVKTRSLIGFIFSLLLLISTCFITYSVGSLQVFICGLLNLYFLAVHYFQIRLQLFFASLFFGGLLVLGISYTYFTQIKTEKQITNLFSEVYQQEDRLALVKNSFKLFKKSPIIGVGQGNWKNEISKFGLKDYSNSINDRYMPRIYNHAHNIVLHFVSESGVIGLICFLAVLVSFFFGVKNESSILEYASLFSFLNYIILSLMYGIIYNHAGHFAPLSIFLILCFSKLTKDVYVRYFINRNYTYILFSLFSLLCASFFVSDKIQTYKIRNNIESLAVIESDRNGIKLITRIFERALTHYSLARFYEKKNENNLARKEYIRALEKDPYNPLYLYNYGNFLYNLGNYEEALYYSNETFSNVDRFLENKLLKIKCLKQLQEKELYNAERKELLSIINKSLKKLDKLNITFRKQFLVKMKKDLDGM